MPKTLVIAEKPSVAADIAKVVGAKDKSATHYEGEDWVVSWAVGHLLEMAPPEKYDDKYKRWVMKDLPILPKRFTREPVNRTKKQLAALKKLLKRKDVERVVNGCDAGREGELIFREIYEHAKIDKPVDRLWLQSMTAKAIGEAIENPRPVEEVQGLADAAYCRSEADWLRGVFELARRVMDARIPAGAPFLSPRQIFDHFHARMRDRKREMFLVVLLDARHRVLREEIVSEGSLTTSIVHPREVFCAAVRESAGAVVLVHNHPSGDPAPSEEDVAVTRRLVQASELIGIRILDHVIVGDGCYTSFKEAGLL